jgi:hypothetical protein
MKIAYFGESPADQAALAVFTEALLGEPPEDAAGINLEAHGVTGVLSALDGVLRGVHYNSDAEGLVIVVDSDDTELHDPVHDTLPGGGERCRFCEIQRIIARVRRRLNPRPARPELKVAVGLAVPAIEAWYLGGKEREVKESAWRADQPTGPPPFTRAQLKQLVYNTDRPSLELETECAVNEARRLIQDIEVLEAAFPVGFGLMARVIRSWATQG